MKINDFYTCIMYLCYVLPVVFVVLSVVPPHSHSSIYNTLLYFSLLIEVNNSKGRWTMQLPVVAKYSMWLFLCHLLWWKERGYGLFQSHSCVLLMTRVLYRQDIPCCADCHGKPEIEERRERERERSHWHANPLSYLPSQQIFESVMITDDPYVINQRQQ